MSYTAAITIREFREYKKRRQGGETRIEHVNLEEEDETARLAMRGYAQRK
jgi:hypothetical protein